MLKKIILLFLCLFVFSPICGMELVQKVSGDQDQKGLGEVGFPDYIDATNLKIIFGYRDGESEHHKDVKRVKIGKSNCIFKGSPLDYRRIIGYLAKHQEVCAYPIRESYGGEATTMGIGYEGGIADYQLFLGEQPAQKPMIYELLWTKKNSTELQGLKGSQLAIYLDKKNTSHSSAPDYFLMCKASDKGAKEIESCNPKPKECIPPTKMSDAIYKQIIARLKGDLSGSAPNKKDANCEDNASAEEAYTLCCNAVIDWAFANGMAEKTDCVFQLSIAQEKEALVKKKNAANDRNAEFVIGAITGPNLSKEALEVLLYVYPTIVNPLDLFEKFITEVKTRKESANAVREFLINLNFAFTQFPTGKKNLLPYRDQLEELDALVALPTMFFRSSNFPLDRNDKPIASPRVNPSPFFRDFQTGIFAEEFMNAQSLLTDADFFHEINEGDLASAIKSRAIELYKDVTLFDIVLCANNSKELNCEFVRFLNGIDKFIKYAIKACMNDETKKRRTINAFYEIALQYLHDGDFLLANQFYMALAYMKAGNYIDDIKWKELQDPLTERQPLVFRADDERPYMPRLDYIAAKLARSELTVGDVFTEEKFIHMYGATAELFKDYLTLRVFEHPTPSCTNTRALEFVRTLTYFTDIVSNSFLADIVNNNIVIVRKTSTGQDNDQKQSDSRPRKLSSARDTDQKQSESRPRKLSSARDKEQNESDNISNKSKASRDKRDAKKSGLGGKKAKFHKESSKK